MFGSLRWRLALWFVTVTGVIYLLSIVIGSLWFYKALNSSLDQELEIIAAEVAPTVIAREGRLAFVNFSGQVAPGVIRHAATVQLFDGNGRLYQQIGSRAVKRLCRDQREVSEPGISRRVFSTVLRQQGRIDGYLQVQLPTRMRDQSIGHYAMVSLGMLPLLAAGLGIAGYLFAGRAARPIEDSFRTLTRFMADVGHELGTPLSVIQVNAESLEPLLEEREIPVERLRVIAHASERMGRLVKDLMLLVKMERPRVTGSGAPLSFDEAVISVVEEFREPFHRKGIELVCEKVDQVVVIGEMDHIKRLVANLVGNALRYTDSGGRVRVALSHSGRTARLTVRDTGIGIPPEARALIFERFYRVDKERSRAEGGTGLGLAIVKAIVDAAKGKIEVFSQVGKGSSFIVTLPAFPSFVLPSSKRGGSEQGILG